MAKLINGNGNPAIYAAEDADMIAALAGDVTGISRIGNKFAATEEDANTIGLADGVIITKEGRRIQLDAGQTDLFTIPSGSTGVTNYYIIGYKLTTAADSTQVCENFVQKMNSSSETITENTFRGGATDVYVSLYRVTQIGFTIDSVVGLLPELPTINDSSLNPLTPLKTTTFPSDGSILDTYSPTETMRTVFNSDGSISEIYTKDGKVIEHKTIFNSNGSISVVDVPQP